MASFRIRKIAIASLVTSLSSLLVSCGPNDFSPEFKTSLKKGRKPAYATHSKSESDLALNQQSEIYDTRTDAVSGDVSWILFNLSVMPSVDKKEIQSFATQKLVQYEGVLGTKIDQLEGEVKEISNSSYTMQVVTFKRIYEGLVVRDAYVQAYFIRAQDGSYRLREIVNRSFGEISAVAGELPSLNVSAIASETGLQSLELKLETPYIVVSVADDKYVFSYAKTYKVKDASRDEEFALTYSGNELVEAFSFNQSIDHRFSVIVPERSYVFQNSVSKPLPLVDVATADGATTTTIDGVATFPTFTDGTTVQMQLASNTALAFVGDLAVTPQPNVSAALYQFQAKGAATDMNPTAAQLPAIMAYLSAHETMTFVRKYLTAQQVPQLDQPIQSVVNENAACNAFWNGSFVTLFAQGAQGNVTCANTALVADIIYHEIGHGIDQFTGPQDPNVAGITDGAFSEGIGDIISSYMTGSPNLAPGFYLNDSTPLRTTLGNKVYPTDLVNEVHDDGEIISAAFWKFRETYVKRYGAKAGARMAAQAFFDHLLTTGAYVDSYAAISRLDDVVFDDGNPATPSKNFCAVNESFAVHGLATAANCQDANVLYYDPNLKLAVRSNDGQGNIGFWASAKGAAKVVLCRGGRDACRASQAEDVAFKKVRVAADDIDIFKSESALSVQKDEEFTLLSFNDAGTLIGTSTAIFEGGQLN